MSEKVYWIGDNKDEKSALIDKVFYLPGDEIPADKVAVERLANWKVKGLVSGGANSPPVVVRDTERVKALEAEIRTLKTKLDALPALENQNKELKAEIEKAKTGKKAVKLKDLELDIKEKAALIEQQSVRIVELEGLLEDATKPDEGNDEVVISDSDEGNDAGAGPGSDDAGAGPGAG